ncbi:type I-E CRISPR-associated protein Cse1/CasA [Rothia sp. P7208]|uniref:type I-E CRISPR-associated protein Cse1/CasA n=1 Tax=Rothia sp. P7208 TaxID=3402660 RepID=UPI003AD2BE87
MVDILKDVPFVKLTSESVTVKEALLQAHKKGVLLDKKIPGYQYAAFLRLLTTVLAVTLRHCGVDNPKKTPQISEKLLELGIPEEALDKALEELATGSDLFDGNMPFVQRPPVTPTSAKDSARALGPGQQPVKKLSPAMPSDAGEDFWNLSVAQPQSISLEQAVTDILVYHHYSMAGNNTYDGDKCAMGAPGIRYLGKGNAATEIFWQGESLLATLLMAIPKSWVFSKELPAWADREGKTKAKTPSAEPSLWDATWSSNTVATYWEDKNLAGVRVGGIPEKWYVPEMGPASDKQARKNWWDTRNTLDPFYLYMPNQSGELKAQRLDFGRDATDLAVEWAAESKVEAASKQLEQRFYDGDGDETLCFIRHQIEGTASSPSIRASSVYQPDSTQWVFDANEELQEAIQTHAKTIQELHNIVRAPFRRMTEGDKKRRDTGKGVVAFDDLEHRRKDASAYFWREIGPVYEEFVICVKEGEKKIPREVLEKAQAAALRAYDKTIAPHISQHPERAVYVRGILNRRLHLALFSQS